MGSGTYARRRQGTCNMQVYRNQVAVARHCWLLTDRVTDELYETEVPHSSWLASSFPV